MATFEIKHTGAGSEGRALEDSGGHHIVWSREDSGRVI